ncbi:MAG TPA: hypothetical protein VN799_09360 [Acidimicrobiales bacterium]|nr:hypothetical protein [Acidimicrobiales bacterium]
MSRAHAVRSGDHAVTEEALRPADGELRVLPPTFVALSEDQAEAAVSALAELLAAATERTGGEAGGTAP